MTPSPKDPLLGTLIDGRYRVDRSIGAGGFGTVYAATHLGLGATVALKVLKLPERVRPEQLVKLCGAFFVEARTLKRLRHPNIVAALDVGLLPAGDDGVELPYLVMEWCDGPTLAEHLEACGRPLSLGEAWLLFEPILGAMGHAHDQRVAHRDLKPSNVLLEIRGASIEPRVVDFGIAKLVSPGAAAGSGDTNTVSGASPFTPRYAAPEQLVGARTGPWTDVHALALLFVELVIGHPAIGKDQEAIAALFTETRPTPKAFGIDVGGLEPVLQRALALRPDERFADATALADAMRAFAMVPAAMISGAEISIASGFIPMAPTAMARDAEARESVHDVGAPSSRTFRTQNGPADGRPPRVASSQGSHLEGFGTWGERGQVIGGRFRIEEHAGAGGSSVVYRATDTRSGASVALKVPHDPTSFDRLRFEREVQILSGATDRRIVGYIAHGIEPDARPWLAMEWLVGETLSSRLSGAGVPIVDAVRVAIELAETLASLHDRGIVHRDIKPSNLFLVDGDMRRPKLLDFGIARSRAHVALTNTGALVGTVGYMSPEQVRGEKLIDHRSDIFSLGCLLFQCVTGHLPFEGEHPTEWLLKLALEEAPRADSIASEVPAGLSDVLAKMLQKSPVARYANMLEVATALGSIDTSEGADQKSVVSVRAPAITSSERRFVSLLLLREPALDARRGVLVDEVRRNGGVLHESPDGLVVVTFEAVAIPTDLACSVARFALSLTSRWPSSTIVVLSTWLTRHKSGFTPAIQTATALLAMGAPGSVIVDEPTRGLLQGAIASSPIVSDSSAALRAHVLAGELATPRRETSPFVGRERELGTVVDAFEHAVSESTAEVVIVLGAPGVGKSRLAADACARIAAARPRTITLVGAAESTERAGSLGLIESMARRFFSVHDGMVEPEQLKSLLSDALASIVDSAWLALEVDFMCELLLASTAPSPSAAVHAARAEPRLMTDQLGRAVDLWLRGLLRSGPLLIHIDSLHSADEASLALLDRFLGTVTNAPVLVLATGRPEANERFPALFAERSVTTIKLRELSTRASESLARSLLPSAPEALLHRVVELGSGNPFLLEELARAVREGHDRELPVSVLALSQSRLDRLTERERRFLRAASVFGDRFVLDGVRALLANADESETLESLERRDVVRRVGSSNVEGSTYAFPSSIVREVAYASIPETECARAHLRAADFLESHGETRPLELAFHLDRAGEPTRAATWYLRAARQSLDAMDLPFAARWADMALEADPRPAWAGAALCLRAQVEEARWAWAEVKRFGLEAMRLVPEGGVLWFMAAHSLLPAYTRSGDIAGFVELTKRLRETTPLPEAVNTAVNALARSANMFGVAGQVDQARETLASMDALEGFLPAGASGAASALMARGGIAMTSGDLGSYRTLRHEAADRFELLHDWRRAIEVRGTGGYADALLGRYEEALSILSQCVSRAVDYQMTTVHYLRHNVGFVLFQLGRYAEARDTLEATLAPLSIVDARLERGSMQYLARALVALGQRDLAEQHARTALSGAERPIAKMAARGDLAHVLLAQGRWSEALTLAEEAAAPLASEGPFDESEMFIRVALLRSRMATGDISGAKTAAREAKERLGFLAARISDPSYKRSFLDDVVEHVALRRVSGKLG